MGVHLAFLLSVALLVALLFGGCGYKQVKYAQALGDARRVSVQTLSNDSDEPGIEMMVSEALRREFLRRGAVVLVEDPEKADLALRGRVLGIRTRQLNGDFAYPAATDNQLRAWNNINLLTTDIGVHTQYEALPDPEGSAPTEDRARAYMAVNCAICHLPGGPTPTDMDLRYGTPLAQTRLVNVAALNGDFPLRLSPGSKETSVLWDRMRRLDLQRMPPLGSAVVHQTAADLLGAWIDGQ